MIRRARKKGITSPSRGLLASFLAVLMMLVVACGMTALDIPEKGEKAPESTKKEIPQKSRPEKNSLSEERVLRAWVHSVMLRPGQVNKDGTLKAFSDWGPTGRAEMSLHYEWFVNDRKVSSGASSRLSLSEFRSGDRVYVVSQVFLKQGQLNAEKVIASRRSRSIVIQNRPPRLESDFKAMRQKDDALVGQIEASDPDGDFFTMRLLEGPKGLSLSAEGEVRWALSQVTPGAQQMMIELEDERGLGFRGTLAFSIERESRG